MANEPVDISRAIAAARLDAERYAESDPVYAEIMATYVDMGEVLQRPVIGQEEAELCQELARRLLALEVPLKEDFDAKWALWCSRNMRPLDGGDE